MLRRAFVLLLGTLALGGCGGSSGRYTPGYGGGYQPLALTPPANPVAAPNLAALGRIAILLPLSGPRAETGQAMLQAAQLALSEPGSPTLQPLDTGGTPDGAAGAARTAIAGGAGLILGPLTSAETAAVGQLAAPAGVLVLAFTNDSSQAQPGVWTLGITPEQQVRRLVAAAQAQGRTQIAALLPDGDFGRSMGDALSRAATANGLPAPDIRFHAAGMAAITAAARDLSGYATRRGPIDAQVRAARALGTADGRRQAQELVRTPIPPPAFNALLLADTGDALQEIAAVLPYYDVDRSAVQIMGPALWSSPSSGSGHLEGAWYAAPDPSARAGLEQSYAERYGVQPPPLADLAFDAASIARVLASQGGFSPAGLTQPGGFASGAGGWLALLPDGQVRRALAVFRIERGGPAMVEPAPASGAGM